MNELLAILVYAFFSETLINENPNENLSEKQIAQLKDDDLMKILFDKKNTFADIYWCFDRLMSMGVKHLYQVTKDIT